MKLYAISIYVFFFFGIAGNAFGQVDHGAVILWGDGSRMDCPFYFEQEPFYDWQPSTPPPITIQAAAAIAKATGEEKHVGNIWVKGFRVIGVRPHEHDHPMLVMFVNYQVIPKAGLSPVYEGDNQHWIAITPRGNVVEETCDGA